LDLYHHLLDQLDLLALFLLQPHLLDLLDLFHHLADLLALLADKVAYIEYRSLYRADRDQMEDIEYLAQMDYNMDYMTYLIIIC
jgi:hypothetical protein